VTGDETGMLRIISEPTSDIGEEFCACFIGWQEALDSSNVQKIFNTT
jgi:hypothetical protein